MSEVNKSLRINPVQRNYTYSKRESQECENDLNSPSGVKNDSAQLILVYDSRARTPLFV